MKRLVLTFIIGITGNIFSQNFHRYTYEEILNFCPEFIKNITEEYHFKENNDDNKIIRTTALQRYLENGFKEKDAPEYLDKKLKIIVIKNNKQEIFITQNIPFYHSNNILNKASIDSLSNLKIVYLYDKIDNAFYKSITWIINHNCKVIRETYDFAKP